MITRSALPEPQHSQWRSSSVPQARSLYFTIWYTGDTLNIKHCLMILDSLYLIYLDFVLVTISLLKLPKQLKTHDWLKCKQVEQILFCLYIVCFYNLWQEERRSGLRFPEALAAECVSGGEHHLWDAHDQTEVRTDCTVVSALFSLQLMLLCQYDRFSFFQDTFKMVFFILWLWTADRKDICTYMQSNVTDLKLYSKCVYLTHSAHLKAPYYTKPTVF